MNEFHQRTNACVLQANILKGGSEANCISIATVEGIENHETPESAEANVNTYTVSNSIFHATNRKLKHFQNTINCKPHIQGGIRTVDTT